MKNFQHFVFLKLKISPRYIDKITVLYICSKSARSLESSNRVILVHYMTKFLREKESSQEYSRLITRIRQRFSIDKKALKEKDNGEMWIERDADSLKSKLLLCLSTSRSTTGLPNRDFDIFNVSYKCDAKYNLFASNRHIVFSLSLKNKILQYQSESSFPSFHLPFLPARLFRI